MHKQTKELNCTKCGESFSTKNALYEHLHNEHNLQRRERNKICQYCGCIMTNIRKHMSECTQRRHKGFHWTEEEKKRLSESRKRYLMNNPDKHPWKHNDKFISKPCEHLKNILREHNIEFLEEFTDANWQHNYSADIIIQTKHTIIEVNGNQHYNNGQLTEYYQMRHDYLVAQGYNVIEFHYANCYKEHEITQLIKEISGV